jgi:Tol biopolymer transport system component
MYELGRPTTPKGARAFILVLLSVLVAFSGQVADAAVAVKVGFIDIESGQWGLFTANADGTQRSLLSGGSASVLDFQWSPDGSSVAFSTTSGEAESLYVSTSDGAEPHVVFQGDEIYAYKWSPDAKKLLVATAVSFLGNPNEWKVISDQGDELLGSREMLNPNFSPDSSQLVYSLDQAIHVLTLSDQSDMVVAHGYLGSQNPWSPSAGVFFTVEDKYGNDRIKSVHGDGTQMQGYGIGSDPIPSPSGEKLAYLKQGDLAVIETLSRDQSSFSNVPHLDIAHIQWSPTEEKLLFTALDETDAVYAYTAKTAGGTPKWIAEFASLAGREQPDPPEWAPAGDRILLPNQKTAPHGRTLAIVNPDGTGWTAIQPYSLQAAWRSCLLVAECDLPRLPQPDSHPRRVTAGLLEYEDGVGGKVSVDTHFVACSDRAPVHLQEQKDGKWRTIVKKNTTRWGTYEFHISLRGNRLYRVVAPSSGPQGTGGQTCKRATSGLLP